MQKEIIILLAVSIIFINCKDSSQNIDIGKVQEKPCDKYERKGNVLINCTSWEDKYGTSTIIFSKNVDKNSKAELFVELIKNNSSTPYLNVYDFIKDCPVDFDINYIDNSLSITDLNSDNIKEITFLYESACQGGIGPTAMKLIMIEGKQKYKIRGLRKDEVSIRNPDIAVNYKESRIDKSFDKAPKEFLSFAKKKWIKNHGTQLKENSSVSKRIQKIEPLDEGEVSVLLSDRSLIKFEDPGPSFYNLSEYKIDKDNLIIVNSGDHYGNQVSTFLKLNPENSKLYVIKVIANFVLKQKPENNLKTCTIDNINIPVINYDADEIYDKLTNAKDCTFKTM
ncbi:M949_RS01915 family surface polysaccharide biosynthesis protein [Aquimarina longa]|uniref:M949_RS01915 family surface polysaccharide biosynthesis protein n=1 Tax=Aquimarina longa TaxID=1080221 RepID=UPI000784D2AC|nr:hypothetical protein [Aquimarina longa]